ncbi:MAG: phosphatidylglycerol lysyltransferase domain-containing protein [Muribaculaceae bacterium]|nr:phosphatidylglycerol lysyltransferase domain-containing protein [Muribaculaceae bacterium]
MNTHTILYSPAIATQPTPVIFTPYHLRRRPFDDLEAKAIAARLEFRPVTEESMSEIWNILRTESGRTTDFSYGGLLMWVDYFRYEYAIVQNTLLIKGRVESDVSRVAFSMPVGEMPLAKSVDVLREYCAARRIPLVFSAVPEYALEDFQKLKPANVEELTDWADYLYSAEKLSTLSGKKMSKKRNHVNQFLAAYPGYTFEPLTAHNAGEALLFMDSIDAEGDDTPMAVTERRLNREMLRYVMNGDDNILGGILRDAGGKVLAFTMGDIKGDTLFVHIEKALRSVAGGFEMINKIFAETVCREHPEIRFINREDDSGDEGLRYAKQSYHPLELLRKYNIEF